MQVMHSGKGSVLTVYLSITTVDHLENLRMPLMSRRGWQGLTESDGDGM